MDTSLFLILIFSYRILRERIFLPPSLLQQIIEALSLRTLDAALTLHGAENHSDNHAVYASGMASWLESYPAIPAIVIGELTF